MSPLTSRSLLFFLVAFRLLNALSLRTFFQPDEFFQSLDPAWQIAFGDDQGAWITWEWRHQLRSSLHPLLFAAVYSAADLLAQALRISSASRADLLVSAPKVAQAVIAAIGDFYTVKLAQTVYGKRSREASAALALTVLSPWQWFCSTRTFSNCLETTLTVVALHSWPWGWSVGETGKAGRRAEGQRKTQDTIVLSRLRRCLCLAALACILRPTNILIWVTLASIVWLRSGWTERTRLVREVVLCGSGVLAVSTVADRVNYGFWTFPPLRFLYFNIAQSLAVFYGANDFHYYVSQGYPLLLTTALPFAIMGLYRAWKPVSASDALQQSMQAQLAAVCLIMPLVLSVISHKEVRFIYPLLPALHILAAPQLVTFFLPAVSHSHPAYTPRRLTLVFLILVNVVIALYTSLTHASGVLTVLSYLRQQEQAHAPINLTKQASSSGISVGFLMPCHSTPWRSHLVHPNIHAWALSCDPPVDLTPEQKASYLDEADQFYANPTQFLREHIAGGLRHFPPSPSYRKQSPSLQSSSSKDQSLIHPWPDYLIFFAPLEPTLHSALRYSSYAECARFFNSHWHDDPRRKGDVVVWCLDPAEQSAWRKESRQRAIEARDRLFERVIAGFKRGGSAQSQLGWLRQWVPSWEGLGFAGPKAPSWWQLQGQWKRSWSAWPWGGGAQRQQRWLGVSMPRVQLQLPSWMSNGRQGGWSWSWSWSSIMGGRQRRSWFGGRSSSSLWNWDWECLKPSWMRKEKKGFRRELWS